MQLSKQKHGQQLALLVGAFAALKLYPPQLFDAVGEYLKRHRHVLSLLSAQVRHCASLGGAVMMHCHVSTEAVCC
jgi:hypothetical protein